MGKSLRKIMLIIFVAGLSPVVYAQFYNGHQMSFGKNRVQYNEFVWSYYRYEDYDVYFNEDGVNLAQYTGNYAEQAIRNIQDFFNYNLDNRLLFIVHNRLSDFRQSNIGLITGQDEYNIGGTTILSRNKSFLYFEGDFNAYDEQITAAVARMTINELLYSSELLDNFTNSTLMNMPEWFSEGLVAYLSRNWDIETENRVKDGIMNGTYEKFSRLTGDDAIYAGHSFWKYIADTYGESVISSVIYMTSITKSTKSGFLEVLGLSLKDITDEWVGYYMNLFSDEEVNSPVPETGNLLKNPKRNVKYYQAKISPDGNNIAFVSNDIGLYKIWLYDRNSGRKKRIFKLGYRLEQITDCSYPVIAWHPSGRYLSFITEEKGMLKLYYYNIDDKEMVVRNFLYFEKVLDFSFSDDGSSFVFTGTRNGQPDIYVHDIASSTNDQITNDPANDFAPRFINHSEKIIFTSDKTSDTLGLNNNEEKRSSTTDLFIFDYKNRSDLLIRLSDLNYSNAYDPAETGKNEFIQLNDITGITNRYRTEFDSTISYIDTTIHYRYFARTNPVTQYSRNIREQDYNDNTGNIVEVIYNDNRYRIFNNPLEGNILTGAEALKPTISQTERLKVLSVEDSLQSREKTMILLSDLVDNRLIDHGDTLTLSDNKIDINNYIFEIEKINFYNEQLDGRNLAITVDTAGKEQPRIRLYRPAFYQNTLVSQVDFNFLNASYQAFTGGAFYFNPGFNVLFKIGANDLFEDLKITGGARLSPDFDANEYLLSFENLKKRLDKQIFFHREAFKNTGYGEGGTFEIKTHSHQLSVVLRYPLNQVKALAATFSFRNDRTVYLSNNPNYLNEPNLYKNWLGLKLEYIFDNTRSLGLNLYSGTRYKIFAEFQEQLHKDLYELVVFGADFRHYTRIHRSLIWANRFAWSSSQGTSRIIYYLGGVDNWININPGRTPTFIPFSEIPIDQDQNYAFQAVGTNMRGFSQNIRNGNNFFVFNSEIRFPLFKYIANYPLSRGFFENFQLVGFFDVGSAWSGPLPWSSVNAYDKDIIEQGPITITVDTDRDPIVAGYGFGIHTQLLGYFMRFDWAWGIENRQLLPRIFYFSIGLDF
ncbi:MAG: PD40 domain-containing protein [Bacteroidales bacterium]|nr:PD40 domain-containing protein [Bacteroidales bacterium]